MMIALIPILMNGDNQFFQCIRNCFGQGLSDFCWLTVFLNMKMSENDDEEDDDDNISNVVAMHQYGMTQMTLVLK